jgi:hypothetical protein
MKEDGLFQEELSWAYNNVPAKGIQEQQLPMLLACSFL